MSFSIVTRTLLSGNFRRSAAIWANAVVEPWPMSVKPTLAITVPSEFIFTTTEVAVKGGIAGALCRVATPLPIFRPVRAWRAFSAGSERAIADRFRHRVEALAYVAGVLGDLLAGQRDRTGLEQVLPAELQRVHADGLRHQLHVALEAPEELDVAEAAIRRAVGLVGVDGVGVDPGVGNLVGAAGRVAAGARDVHRVVGVGAGVPEHLHLLRDDAAVGEHAGLDAVGQRAAAGQQREFLFARRLELDRPAARLAGKAGDERLEVDARLAAEPAARHWG